MDKELIKNKLNYIVDALQILKRAIKKSKTDAPDVDLYLFAAEKKAEEIVESAIYINQEILFARNKMGKNYYDSFMELKDLKLFSENELKKMASTAGFRNRLAHDYIDIDERITIKSMEGILKIYPKYIEKILKWLK